MTDVVDQVAADLARLDRQHAAEHSDLIERQASERAALVARLHALAIATANPATDVEPKRRYRPAEIEDWRHVDVAAVDLGGVHPTTVWRWAAVHWAQWPHTARQVDFNKLRHLRPSDAKKTKTAA